MNEKEEIYLKEIEDAVLGSLKKIEILEKEKAVLDEALGLACMTFMNLPHPMEDRIKAWKNENGFKEYILKQAQEKLK